MAKKIINKKMNQRGQITIFIILALILIVGIFLIFLLRRTPEVLVISEKSPQTFIEGCTKDAVEESLELIMINAGDLEPSASIRYQGEDITYLCYEENYYSSCVNQRPLLIEYIEQEIEEYITQRVSNCFSALEEELEPRYDVEMENNWDLVADLSSNEVEIRINRKFNMQRGEEVQNFDLFKISVIHPIYGLAETAMEIVNQETTFCNFDTNSFMLYYPKYDITKFRTGDSSIIYTIKEFQANKEFKFAIRGCVTPPGM